MCVCHSHIQHVTESCHLLVSLLRHLEQFVSKPVHPGAQRHLSITHTQPSNRRGAQQRDQFSFNVFSIIILFCYNFIIIIPIYIIITVQAMETPPGCRGDQIETRGLTGSADTRRWFLLLLGTGTYVLGGT